VKQAKKFIAKNKDAPFFLYFASQSIHVPRAPNKRFQGTTKLGYRGDAMVELDWAVGELMKTLEEYDLTENTIVIFSSDNGPVYDDGYADGTVVDKSSEEIDRGHDGSGIYRGGKYQIYEGGTRVPFIIRWPTRIEPGVSDGLVNQIDFIASFAELLNVDLAAKEARDSRSTLKTFLGDVAVGHDLMLEEANVLALRKGDWKYIEKQNAFWAGLAQAPLLYNLAEDPSEQTNLIEQYSEKAASMAKMLEKMKLSEGIRKMSL
jgi:arylsulfatase A-like enzyme